MGKDYKETMLSTKEINHRDNEMLRLLDHMIKFKNITNVFVLTNDRSHCSNLFNKVKYKTLKFFFSEFVNFLIPS